MNKFIFLFLFSMLPFGSEASIKDDLMVLGGNELNNVISKMEKLDKSEKEKLVSVVIERLKKGDDFRIYSAFEHLGSFGKPAATILFSRLNSYSYNDIKYASEALGYIGFTSSEDLEKLIKFTNDPNPNLQADIVKTIGDWGHNADIAFPRLCELTNSEDWRVRRNAVIAIGKLTPRNESVSCLISAMRNKYSDAGLCIEAIRALGKFGPFAKEAIPIIKKPPPGCHSEGFDHEIKEALEAIKVGKK